jgi:hypothetical protein
VMLLQEVHGVSMRKPEQQNCRKNNYDCNNFS